MNQKPFHINLSCLIFREIYSRTLNKKRFEMESAQIELLGEFLLNRLSVFVVLAVLANLRCKIRLNATWRSLTNLWISHLISALGCLRFCVRPKLVQVLRSEMFFWAARWEMLSNNKCHNKRAFQFLVNQNGPRRPREKRLNKSNEPHNSAGKRLICQLR